MQLIQLSVLAACISVASAQYFLRKSWDGIAAGPNGQFKATFYTGNAEPPRGSPIAYYKKGNNLVMKGDIDVYIMYYTKFKALHGGGDGWGRRFPNNNQKQIIEYFINNIHTTDWWKVVQKYYYQAYDGAPKERIGKLTVRRSILQSCAGGEDPWPGTDPWNYGCGLGQNAYTGADNVKEVLWAQLWQCPNERNQWNQYVNSAFVPYPSKEVITNPNAIYIILTPPDVQESFGSKGDLPRIGQGYCSYHTQMNGKGQWASTRYRYIYAQLPNKNPVTANYPWITTVPASKCIIGNKNTSPNNDVGLDALINILAHEIVETLTNPYPIAPTDDINKGTWLDSNKDENMDKCDSYFTKVNTLSNGAMWNMNVGNYKFLLNPVWDPELQKCSMGDDNSPPNNPPPPSSGTCGNGNRGDGKCSNGQCCSQYGWCGTTSDHCSSGGGGGTTGTCGNGNRGDGKCNNGQCCSQYGWCGTTPDHCSSGGGGTCGNGSRGNGRCADTRLCCSQWGWCGTGSAYC